MQGRRRAAAERRVRRVTRSAAGGREPAAAVSERGSVRFGGATIEYEVRRSRRRRKTVQITVGGGSRADARAGPPGSPAVVVASPASTPPSELEAIVLRRAAWILRRAAAAEAAAPPRRFAGGETLPYLGRNVRITDEPGSADGAEVRFDHWRFRVLAPSGLADADRREAVRRAFVAWYRARAERSLPARVARWWPCFGDGAAPRVLVRNQRRRWGSCAADGTLRLNWRCVMLAPALADYVVVHELAHLAERNHSPAFWRRAASVLPDVRRRRDRLREAGLALPL